MILKQLKVESFKILLTSLFLYYCPYLRISGLVLSFYKHNKDEDVSLTVDNINKDDSSFHKFRKEPSNNIVSSIDKDKLLGK